MNMIGWDELGPGDSSSGVLPICLWSNILMHISIRAFTVLRVTVSSTNTSCVLDHLDLVIFCWLEDLSCCVEKGWFWCWEYYCGTRPDYCSFSLVRISQYLDLEILYKSSSTFTNYCNIQSILWQVKAYKIIN